MSRSNSLLSGNVFTWIETNEHARRNLRELSLGADSSRTRHKRPVGSLWSQLRRKTFEHLFIFMHSYDSQLKIIASDCSVHLSETNGSEDEALQVLPRTSKRKRAWLSLWRLPLRVVCYGLILGDIHFSESMIFYPALCLKPR